VLCRRVEAAPIVFNRHAQSSVFHLHADRYVARPGMPGGIIDRFFKYKI
jgi:hypothetical protein